MTVYPDECADAIISLGGDKKRIAQYIAHLVDYVRTEATKEVDRAATKKARVITVVR